MTKSFISSGLVVAAMLALTACTTSEPAPVAAQMPSMAPVPSADDQACLQAVTQQSQNPDVTLISSDFSQAATTVTVGVGPQKAPWRCLVSRGKVTEVTSLTNEGNL